jgi:membrane protein implicated in regulation of membrane protease activity
VDQAAAVFFDHPFWSWFAIAGMLLIGELMTGSGWLLWPAGSAATVGVAAFVYPPLGWSVELVLFVATAIVSTYVGRRFLRPAPKDSHDVNDPARRLLGHEGETVSPFQGGLGRVFVDGKEWAAELDGGGDLAARAKVEVVEILGGARLRVKAA